MRALFRIAILLLVAHALFRFVPPYWHHNQFQSALKDASQVWGQPTDEEVMEHVLTTAAENDVPITRDHVSVRRQQNYILVDVEYTLPIEWVPTYKKDWPFKAHLNAWRLEPPKPRGR
jgi:hypothetical protein